MLTVSQVKSWKVRRAINLGYVEPGWELMDYIRDAVETYGWENNPLWGPKGGYKSNLMLQIGYAVYKDWDIVLDHFIFTPLDFIRITQDAGRIPFLGWDDISAHLPRTLYMTNRKLWDALARNWDLFRPKLNAFACTTPHKRRVASFILDDLNGEIIVSKRHIYEYQRWSWDLDYKHHDQESKVPIQVEANKQIIKENVPTKVFKRYWKRRIELSNKAHRELLDLFRELEQDSKNNIEVPKELKGMSKKEIRSWAAKVLRSPPDALPT